MSPNQTRASTPIVNEPDFPQFIDHQTTFSPIEHEEVMDTQMMQGIISDEPRFNKSFVFGCAAVAALMVGFYYLSPGSSSPDVSSDAVVVEPEVIAEVATDGSGQLAFAGRQQQEAAAPVAMPVSTTKAQFASNSSKLNADAKLGLKGLVARLKMDKTLRFRIEGHADERGTRQYNYRLGLRRANAVKAYLVANGVSARHLTVVSFGESRPVFDGKLAANRRVEWHTAATLLTER